MKKCGKGENKVAAITSPESAERLSPSFFNPASEEICSRVAGFLCNASCLVTGDPGPAAVAYYQGVVGVGLNQMVWEVITAAPGCGSPHISPFRVKEELNV